MDKKTNKVNTANTTNKLTQSEINKILVDDDFDSLRGNSAIKDTDSSVYINSDDYKVLVEELVKCKNDIVYFAENYFTIIGATGKQIIKLYPKQRELLKLMAEPGNVVTLASRQVGKSTIYTIFALHYTIFNSDKGVLICANKFATAKELLSRIQLAYELLPSWLKMGCKEYNKSKIKFENDSSIEISATSASSARGKSGDILIIDEAAFVPNNIMDEFVQSVLPIVSSRPDSRIIVVSTPNGTGNWYSDTYHKAVLNLSEDGYKAFRIDWWDVPDKDEEWKQKMIESFNGDLRKFNQEYGNKFLGSSQTLINPKAIEFYNDKSKLWKEGELYPIKSWEAKIWYKPERGKTYVMGIDIAEGVGGDYSTILVLDISNTSKLRIVATFANNMISTTDFAYVCSKISKEYNNAYIAGERNGIGKSTLDTMWNVFSVENILCWKSANSLQTMPGIFSNNKNKTDACIWAKYIIDNTDMFEIEFNDKNIVYEIEYFEKKSNTTRSVYEAVIGKHDDYMMALIWALYLIEPTICESIFDIKATIVTNTGMVIPKIISIDSNELEDLIAKEITNIDNIYDTLTGRTETKPVEENFDLDNDNFSDPVLDILDDDMMFMNAVDEFNNYSEF